VLTAPDVLTAFLTTGIPDVEVYFEATALDRATSRALAAFAGVLRTPPWQALMRTQAVIRGLRTGRGCGTTRRRRSDSKNSVNFDG
jgi:hypothetical protein